MLSLLVILPLLQAAEPPRMERLENGLRIVVIEDHALPLVSVQLWVNAGSGLDDPQRPGLCEHTRTALEHRDNQAARIRAAGVHFSSRTLRDACFFSSIAPVERLDFLLENEAKRLSPLVMDDDLRQTVRQSAGRSFPGVDPDLVAGDLEDRGTSSIASMRNTGRSGIHRIELEMAFPGRADRHPPGLVGEVRGQSGEAASIRDEAEFANRWFVPGNAALLIVGDVQAVSAIDAARRHFKGLAWKEPPRRPTPDEPADESLRISDVRGPMPGVDFAWTTAPRGYFENVSIDVLCQYLCNPIDGLITEEMAGLDPGAKMPGGSQGGAAARLPPAPQFARLAWREGGLLSLWIDSASASREKVAEIVRGSIRSVLDGEIDLVRLNRAKSLTLRDRLDRTARFSDRAAELAAGEVIAGDSQIAVQEQSSIMSAPPMAVRRAVEMLEGSRRIVIVRDEPWLRRSSPPPLPPETDAILRRMCDPQTGNRPQWVDGGKAMELLAAAAPRELPSAHAVIRPVEPAISELPGGARLSVWHAPTGGLVTIRAFGVVSGGEISLPIDVAAGGTVARSRAQFADYLSYHGITHKPHLSRGAAGLQIGTELRGPTDRLAQMAELAIGAITGCRADQAAIEAVKSEFAARVARSIAEPADWADMLADGILCSREAMVSGIAPADDAIRKAIHQLRSGTKLQIQVIGDASAEAAVAAVEEAWKARDSANRSASARAETKDEPNQASVPSTNPAPKTSPKGVETWWAQSSTGVCELRALIPAAAWRGPISADADVAAWLIGRSPDFPADVDARHHWRWSCYARADGTLVAACAGEMNDGAEIVRGLIERVAEIKAGRVTPAQAEVAQRLAQTSRLIAADDADRLGMRTEFVESAAADVARPPPTASVDSRSLKAAEGDEKRGSEAGIIILMIGSADRAELLSPFGPVREIPTAQAGSK